MQVGNLIDSLGQFTSTLFPQLNTVTIILIDAFIITLGLIFVAQLLNLSKMILTGVLFTKLKRLILAPSYKTPEIILDFEDTSDKRLPITVDEVKDYISIIEDKKPRSLVGINQIILTDRKPNQPERMTASYTPDGYIIRIFPLNYDVYRNGYYIPITDEGYIRIGLTEEEAKHTQLFALGHEIGHHVIYKKSGQLFGEEVERQCDKFSEDLNIVPNTKKTASKRFHADDPLVPIGDMQ